MLRCHAGSRELSSNGLRVLIDRECPSSVFPRLENQAYCSSTAKSSSTYQPTTCIQAVGMEAKANAFGDLLDHQKQFLLAAKGRKGQRATNKASRLQLEFQLEAMSNRAKVREAERISTGSVNTY